MKNELPLFPVEWRSNRTLYNEQLFHYLEERDKQPISVKLNKFRLELVRKYSNGGRVLDIGPGALTFMKLHGDCLGFDINPYAVEKLKAWGRWFNPYNDSLARMNIGGVTFFDSFEHIENPLRILNRLSDQFVFVSIPIFKNKRHMMRSKHFKPGEHLWHFTRTQFINYTGEFNIIKETDDETSIGREDISTLVLRRKHV